MSQGETIDEAIKNIKEAIEGWIEAVKDLKKWKKPSPNAIIPSSILCTMEWLISAACLLLPYAHDFPFAVLLPTLPLKELLQPLSQKLLEVLRSCLIFVVS